MADPGIIVCHSKCWACQFDQHDPEWHPWADEEDVAHHKATGQPDLSEQRCGCYCCRDADPLSRPGATSTET